MADLPRVDPHHRYLGDGVYASFDGYHVWLRTGSHTNEPAIAIEPGVFAELVRYQRQMFALADRAEQEGE
jgi:hypothetical protein